MKYFRRGIVKGEFARQAKQFLSANKMGIFSKEYSFQRKYFRMKVF
jgi:hypothetical protein